MGLRVMILGGCVALALPAALLAQDGAAGAARNWAAITQCAAIADAAQRHACMDTVVRDAGVLAGSSTAQDPRAAFGQDSLAQQARAAPSREAPSRAVPAPAPPPAVAAAAPSQPAEIDELVTTITSVRTVGYRKLRVTTAEGSVWDQTQAESFATEPKAGDAFTIVRGRLGGYRCQFRSASRYQCDRVG